MEFLIVQATLPFRLGGLGLRESERSAAPTFVGSCNSARILVSCLVETFDVFMPFPREDRSLAFFEGSLCLFLCCITPLKLTFKPF